MFKALNAPSPLGPSLRNELLELHLQSPFLHPVLSHMPLSLLCLAPACTTPLTQLLLGSQEIKWKHFSPSLF